MRRAAKVDRNHGEVRDTLRACGWTVVDTASVGGGFPDLIAARRGAVVFIEVKDGALPPSRKRLTPEEERWHGLMLGAGADVRVVEDAASVTRW